jgi:hypothetical protein
MPRHIKIHDSDAEYVFCVGSFYSLLDVFFMLGDSLALGKVVPLGLNKNQIWLRIFVESSTRFFLFHINCQFDMSLTQYESKTVRLS